VATWGRGVRERLITPATIAPKSTTMTTDPCLGPVFPSRRRFGNRR
jgi:hypothetical protein